MRNEKNWIVLISIIVTAVIVGGVVYYWQYSQAKKDKDSLNSQISSLQSQINNLENPLFAGSSSGDNSQSQTSASTNYLASLKTFCENNVMTAGDSVGDRCVLNNSDGIFGRCDFGIQGGGGYLLIAKIIDNQWVKLLEGNGLPDNYQQIVDQNKIPNNLCHP